LPFPFRPQTRLKLPANLFQGQVTLGQTAPPRPSTDTTGRDRTTRDVDARGRGQSARSRTTSTSPVQRIGQQTYDVDIASIRSVYSPTLSSIVSSSNSKNASTSTISGGQTGATINNSTFLFNGGLTQDVPWAGGGFNLQLDNRRSETSNTTATINPQYNPTWSAAYNQPLLRDFKIDTTRQQLLVTRINQDISDIQLRQVTINTIANVRNAYWDFVFAVQSVETSKQSLALAEELYRNNQAKVEIGTMAPIDVVQAQAQVAAQRQQLVTAEGSQRTAEIALKRLIVSGTNDPLWTSTIDPTDRPDFAPEPSTSRPPSSARCRLAPTSCARARTSKQRRDAPLSPESTAAAGRFPDAVRIDRHRRQPADHGGSDGNGVNRGEVIGIDPGRLPRRAEHALPQPAADMERGH
jgi:outer membrane protein TolC